MLLSDKSQSDASDVTYPPGLTDVVFTEVVRCSQRIYTAAASFQIDGGSGDDTTTAATTHCHHDSPGMPLMSQLFPQATDAEDRYITNM